MKWIGSEPPLSRIFVVLILNFGPILELTTLIPGYIQWTIEVRAKQS